MDTQGLFDSKTTPADNSRIFSLGTLISSVQIFKFFSVIEETQLQYLQLAVDFASSAAKYNQNSSETKPFQKLLFLIRDWCDPSLHPFGFKGGNSYIMELLTIQKNQHTTLKSFREFIFSSFDEKSCCLFPEPGKTIRVSSINDGSWSKMEKDFIKELKFLIETILLPNKLVIKKLDNRETVAAELKNYFEKYLDAFKLDGNFH